MKFFKNLVLLFAVTIFFPSCSSLLQEYADNIEIEINSVRLKSIDILERTIDVEIVVAIRNSNSFTVSASEIKYKVYVDESYLGNGEYDNEISLKSNSSSQIGLPVSTKAEIAILNLITGGYKLNYKVTGTANVKAKGIEFNLPFEVDQEKIILK